MSIGDWPTVRALFERAGGPDDLATLVDVAKSVPGCVVRREPHNTAAWYQLVITARGLQLGIDEARRRFDQVVAQHPGHIRAHQQMLQQLCLKRSGSHEAMPGDGWVEDLVGGPWTLEAPTEPAGGWHGAFLVHSQQQPWEVERRLRAVGGHHAIAMLACYVETIDRRMRIDADLPHKLDTREDDPWYAPCGNG